MLLVVLLARDTDRPAPVVHPGPRLIRSVVVGELSFDVRGGLGSGRVYDGGVGLISWAVVQGTPWTVRRDGTLLQLDPGSWRVERRLRIAGAVAPFYLLATPGDGLLLSSRSGGFRRIDPTSGRTVWRIAPAASVQQWELIGSRFWCAVSGPGLPSAQLVEADVATGRTLGRLRLPTFDVFGIGRVGADVWVTGTGGRVAIVRP